MKALYAELIKVLGENRVEIDKPLRNFTSLKIGGPADLFFKAQNTEELTNAIKLAKKNKIPYCILGGGTNILVSDKGFRGIVIKNESGGIKLRGITGRRISASNKNKLLDKVYLEVDSGVTINRLVRNTVDQGLKGLENFLGQPGTVGGAVWINAHNAKEKSYFGDKLVSARIFTLKSEVIEVNNAYFHFNYDYSVLQKTKESVLSVTLELLYGKKDYLWQVAKKELFYRQNTQPAGVFTAGCLFRNIDKSMAMRLATPEYTCSAGFLLDTVGMKNVKVGDAAFSEKHANFLINLGSASATDVLKLIDLAKEKVKNKYGIDLELEIVKVGDF